MDQRDQDALLERIDERTLVLRDSIGAIITNYEELKSLALSNNALLEHVLRDDYRGLRTIIQQEIEKWEKEGDDNLRRIMREEIANDAKSRGLSAREWIAIIIAAVSVVVAVVQIYRG